MTTATKISSAHHPSLQRVPLAPISDFSLNISKNSNQHSTPFALKSKSFNLPSVSTSTPQSRYQSATSQFVFCDQNNQLTNAALSKRSLSTSESQTKTPPSKRAKITISSTDLNDDDIFTSPTLEKARMLKVKLQLAYYKVKTNQTKVLLKDLQHKDETEASDSPSSTADISNILSSSIQPTHSRSALADLLAASTPIIGKQRTLQMTKSFSESSVPSGVSTNATVVTRKRPTLKRAGSSMDEVVKKRGVSANLKRASVEFMKSIPDLHHPAQSSTIPSESLPQTESQHSKSLTDNIGNTTQSSNIIPVPRNKQLTTFITSTHTTTSPSKFAITSPTDDQHNQSSTTSNNNKAKFRLPPVPSFAFDIPPIRRTLKVQQDNSLNTSSSSSSSSTTLVENTQSLLITPIRKPSSDKSRKNGAAETEATNDDTTINNDNENTNTNDNDNDETQLMSSPTRLMSTPSSIGAARCLLQLAHR